MSSRIVKYYSLNIFKFINCRKVISLLIFVNFCLFAQTEFKLHDKIISPRLIKESNTLPYHYTSLTPTFKWENIENANGYTIYIYEIKENIKDSIFSSSEYGNISHTFYTIPENILSEDKKYEITMRAFNTKAWSDYSEPMLFSIKLPWKNEKINKSILPPPTIITKNNLRIDTISEGNSRYSLVWNNEESADSYQIIIDGIKSSTIFGQEYSNIVSETVADTIYYLDPEILTYYNNYRWKIRSKNNDEWSRFSSYYYFNLNSDSDNEKEYVNKIEEILLKFKFAGFIEKMIIAKYNKGRVFLPLMEIFSLLQLNHKFDLENKTITGERYDIKHTNYFFDMIKRILNVRENSIHLTSDKIIDSDLDYFVTEEIIEESTGLSVELDMRNLTVEITADFIIPMVQRMMNERKLGLYKNSLSKESYPLLFNRERKNISGGFLDYSATANYLQNQSPYYTLQMGVGAELFGGDVQVNTQQSYLNNRLAYNQMRYRWRYAFLNNEYISNVSIGHSDAIGLQSYQLKGISISNEPVEARRIYGRYTIEEETQPNFKVEVYHNGQIIDIIQADEQGKYNFLIPFSYGTTLLELHEIGPEGEYNVKNKMYQIPTEQVPKGKLDYSVDFGQIVNTSEYILQSNASYGVNNWLTTKIGTDLFTGDLKYSSIYSNTTARLLDGYIVNLTLAPNAYNELSLSSIYSDLATFNFGVKLFDKNVKLNPTKIHSQYEGNIFVPFKVNSNLMSLLLRGRQTHYNNSNRSELSFRTFYNYKNISPSLEFDYYSLANNDRKFESAFLNFRINYSMYIQSAVFSGNIFNARFVYDLLNKRGQALNFSISTTLFRQFRIQLSHTANFRNSNYDTQLRIVFDLPFFRSNTIMSKNVFSQSFVGSVNYNEHNKELEYYNRGMIGRSAATFKFFVDRNLNEQFDLGEDLVPDMDIQINSIGSKRRASEGNIIVNDLESYSKYDVKLVEKHNKNPLWYPYKNRFSFISDPHQYKEIQVPFYEAAEVSGTVRKKVGDIMIPVSSVNIVFKNINTDSTIIVKSMSDGSYYHYGLQPGEYKIFIDHEHLKRMRLKSNPNTHRKLIKSISLEEEFNEFDFYLE